MCNHAYWSMKKSETNFNPRAVTPPAKASPVATPSHDNKPWPDPPYKPRLMHSRPVGPMGTAMTKPMMRPLKKTACNYFPLPVGLLTCHVHNLGHSKAAGARKSAFESRYIGSVVCANH